MEILIKDKEDLAEKIQGYLLKDFVNSLQALELDEEEKQANIVLSRKKMRVDSENIAELIYKAYEV
jgi:hypothetical protein